MIGVLRSALRWGELRRSGGLRALVLLSAITLFQELDTQVFQTASPDVARDLGTTVGAYFGLLGVIGVVTVVGSLWLAWLADRRSRVRMLAVGTMLTGVGAAVSAQGGSIGVVGTGRVIDEASSAAAETPVFSLLADYYPPSVRGRAFALLGVMGSVGALVSLIVAGIGITHLGWRPMVLIAGVPLFVLGVLVVVALRDPTRGYWERRALGEDERNARVEDEPLSFGEAFRTTFAARTLRRVFLGTIFSSAGMSIFLYLVSFFLADYYGLDAFGRSMVLVPSLLAAILGAFLGGGLLDLLNRRGTGWGLGLLGAYSLVSAVGVGVIGIGVPLSAFVVFSAVVYLGGSLVGPAAGVVLSQVLPPQIRTQGLAVITLSTLPGAIVALPVAGALVDTFGYSAAITFAALLLVVGGVVQWTAAPLFEFDRRSTESGVRAHRRLAQAAARGTEALLVCSGVEVAYAGTPVLFGVDVTIHAGEVVALLGTNGAGKSTLLRAISGVQEATRGAIVFDGRDITHMPPHEIARRGVVHMPGGRGIFPDLSVRDNLALALWSQTDADVDARIAEVTALFPSLRDRLAQPARVLSGGEQQMVSLGQAFLARPRLLLIDELSLGLSPAAVGELLGVVRRINEAGTTIVVVEQSVNLALTIARRAVFMEKGEVRFDGPTAELFARPDVLRAVYVTGTGGVTARRASPADTAAHPILSATGIRKAYAGVVALDGVDLDVARGRVVGIVGPNGSGKTTLLDVISGYQPADAGSVVLDGVDVTALPAEQRARRGLVRRFQDARLFPSLTLEEALLVAADRQLPARSTLSGALGLPRARRADREARRRADAILDLLSIGDYRHSFLRELSTGVRRLADLAFVLATRPQLLLLDEPSAGVAQAEAENLAPLIARVRRETGCSILVIEHDIPLVTALADELVAMVEGRIVARGPATDVLADNRVVAAYLGTTDEAIFRSGVRA